MFDNKIILDKPKDTKERLSNNKRNLIILCMENNNIKGLKELIEKNGVAIEVDRLNWTYLHYAAFHNNVDAAKELLKAGLKVNALDVNHETPLSVAALNESTDMVKFLIKRRANILNKNQFGYTVLDILKVRASYTTQERKKEAISEIIQILEEALQKQQKKEKVVISNIEKSR